VLSAFLGAIATVELGGSGVKKWYCKSDGLRDEVPNDLYRSKSNN
jgi:hypothetical protein